MELCRSGRGSLDFGESFVEDFGNVEKTDDVAVFVAYRLKEAFVSFGTRLKAEAELTRCLKCFSTIS